MASPTRTGHRRFLAAAAALALAAGAPAIAINPGPAEAAAKTGSAPAAAAAKTGTVAAAAAKKADIPCPKPNVKPPAGRPARPVPPKDDPVLRAVGGDDLATDGLIIPAGAPAPPAITATSWVVADLDTGEVLGGCGPHVYGTPASVQKLLLAATVMPELDPKSVTTITQDDVNIEPGSSAVGLVRGGQYSVSTLWLGLLLESGNDAANTLARLAGGTGGVARTVANMNAEAQRLGAYETHAATPSGLDGPGQFTSAYDLALIARVDFDRPEFVKYALTRSTEMPAQKKLKKAGFQIQNENKLIFKYPGALGGKTGFTTLARHSYVGAAQRNGRRLVATLLGAEANPLRGYDQGAALLNWGFSLPKDATVGQLVAPGSPDPKGAAQGASLPPSTPRKALTPAAARPASRSPQVLSLVAAAAVAVVLAGTPLVILSTQRRRRRVRRTPSTQPLR